MAQLWSGSGQTLVDGNGTPYASWKLYTYDTGTTTNKATYSDAGLTSSNTNPVVADSNGRIGAVYLAASRYKLVAKTSADVTLWTQDPVDGTLELVAAASAPAVTFPFMRYHNTTDGHVYRRNSGNSAWLDEGPVDGIGNAASVSDVLTGTSTSVLVTPDALASLWQRGADLASASTISLPAGGGSVFNITGTTTINGISSAQGGRTIELKFAGALTLTHNATSFILPGGANITTVAGDCAMFINEAAQDASGSNWRCFNYETSDGRILPTTAAFATQAQQEAFSSTSVIVSPGRQHFHPASPKHWVNFTEITTTAISVSYDVSSLTDGGSAITTINFTTAFSSASYAITATGGDATATSGWTTIWLNTPASDKLAGSYKIKTATGNFGSNTVQDVDNISMVFFGDL